MKADTKWTELGWRHPIWNVIRFYLSITGSKNQKAWIDHLKEQKEIQITDRESLPIPSSVIDLLFEYLQEREKMFNTAYSNLRDEENAIAFCSRNNVQVGKTATKNQDHHQASKAMICAVSFIANKVCSNKGISIDDDPQKRCAWCKNNELHVTARNLDGAVPGLINPYAIWEIKEYWGKTKGGSKMSDAVYECQLVGHELLDYSSRANHNVQHIVFLDGKEQWGHRKSDLKRFLDLLNQGLVDHLIIGQEIEEIWEPLLEEIIDSQ